MTLLSSQFIDFGSNQKRICDFLCNLGPIFHRLGDIAGFGAPDPPVFNRNFGVFPLQQIAHVGVSLKLFGREIVFEQFQPM